MIGAAIEVHAVLTFQWERSDQEIAALVQRFGHMYRAQRCLVDAGSGAACCAKLKVDVEKLSTASLKRIVPYAQLMLFGQANTNPTLEPGPHTKLTMSRTSTTVSRTSRTSLPGGGNGGWYGCIK